MMKGGEEEIRRPQPGDGPIKYKDVFEMTGEMGEQPISPRDAAAMESAENRAFGKTIKGGPASIMLSAAALNLQAGLVPDDAADGSTSNDAQGSANMLTDDKATTKSDAEQLKTAESRGDPDSAEPLHLHAVQHSTTPSPGGVAETVVAAAGRNQPDK